MDAPPTLRPAREDDAPELARLLTALGHPTDAARVRALWEAWSAGGGGGVVADAGSGRLAGVATTQRMLALHRPAPVGRITALVVDEPFRGRGIGRALVEAAAERLAEAGCRLLEVTSNLRRAEAHAFYERIGLARTSLRFARPLDPPR